MTNKIFLFHFPTYGFTGTTSDDDTWDVLNCKFTFIYVKCSFHFDMEFHIYISIFAGIEYYVACNNEK